MSQPNNRSLCLVLILCAVALSATPARAQDAEGATSAPATAPAAGQPGRPRELTRDEEIHLLEAEQAKLRLEQAQTEMRTAKAELDTVQRLYDGRTYTVEELTEAQQGYQRASLKVESLKIELQTKRLEFLKDATLIMVADAKKFRGADGEIMVSITLRNASDINKARIAMADSEEPLSDSDLASLLKVDSVVVTLKGRASIRSGSGEDERQTLTEKSIVGDPFYWVVSELEVGPTKEKNLTFRLVKKDVDSVTVSLEFLGTRKDYDVFLKMESQQDLPEISSTQYSLEGELNSLVRYDLTLDRLAKTERAFPLVAINLPPAIPLRFIDPSSKARLTSVKFTEEITKQSLYLEVSVPERLDPKLIGVSIPFYVMVTKRTELKKISQLKKQYDGGIIPPEEVAKLQGDMVERVLIPRGVGKLETLIPNLFKEIEQGDPVSIKFNIMNAGTLPLRRVTPELDLPLEWEGQLEPAVVPEIGGGQKVMLTASITPAADVEVGEYTVKIRVEGHAGTERVDAPDKDMTIRVASTSSLTGTVILVAVLVVLVLGIAIASIKISRR